MSHLETAVSVCRQQGVNVSVYVYGGCTGKLSDNTSIYNGWRYSINTPTRMLLLHWRTGACFSVGGALRGIAGGGGEGLRRALSEYMPGRVEWGGGGLCRSG